MRPQENVRKRKNEQKITEEQRKRRAKEQMKERNGGRNAENITV